MNINKLKYLIGVSIVILAVVSAMALTKSNKTNYSPPKDRQEKQQGIYVLPPIVSQVKDLEVVKATLKNKGTPDAVAVLEIKNNSDKPVVAVSVEIGEPEEAYGITVNGFKGGDEPPLVVIEPHKSITVRLPLNNAKLGEPIRVSGVAYADDSEEGEKTALETIRSQREHSKSEPVKAKRKSSLRPKGDPSPR